jgi:hypothetical protein
MPTQPQRTYADIIDEWLQAKRNGVAVGPMPGDRIQQTTDTVERAAAGRLGTVSNGLDPWAASVQHSLQGTAPVYTPPTGQEIRPSAVTGQMGEDLGSLVDLVAPQFNSVAAAAHPGAPTVMPTPKTDTFQRAGRAVGENVLSMATTLPLLASPLGLPIAVAKSYGEAYTPHADPVAGFIGAAGMAAAPGAVSGGSRLAEAAAERFLLPSVGRMAREGAPAVVEGLKTAVNPATHTALTAARVGGGVAGGTAVAEGQRQAQSLAETGELAPLSGPALATDLGLNLAFAAPIVRAGLQPRGKPVSRGPDGQPVFNEQAAPLVAETMDRAYKAQTIRNARAEKSAQYEATRGRRIADSHQEIFTAAERGADPTEAIGKLKAHWEEAAQVTDPNRGLAVLRSIADEGNTSGLSDETFHRIIAGVQGKYNDFFKSDPNLPGPDTVNTLVERGLLPKFTKEEISEHYFEALQQTLGDVNAAKSVTVNRLLAAQMERLPGAVEAQKTLPVEEALTKTTMGQMTDSAKDAQYMESIIRLTPHLKNAVVVKGGVDDKGNAVDLPLLRALYQRDESVSAPMFDASGPFSTGRKAKYDAWRDAVIQVATTYNPATRQGMYQQFANKPPVPISFEDMVAMKDGKYIFKPRVIREVDRPGASEAVRDAIAYVDEITGNKPDSDDEISLEELNQRVSGAPAQLGADKGIVRSGRREIPDEEILADATELGVDPKNFEKFLGDMRDFEQGGLGLESQPSATLYDIGLHLMSKVAKGDSAEMYHKYGAKYFGKQDPATKKPELFQKWLLARLESEIGQQGSTKSVSGAERTDTTQITKAQADFYNAWRKVANEKRVRDGKEPIAEPQTFAEKREQYRHALRLYAGTGGNVDMKQLFIDLLDDNKTYRNFLQKAAGQVQKSQAEPSADRAEYDRLQAAMRDMGFDKVGTPEFTKLWQQSEDIKNRNEGMPPGTKAADPQSSLGSGTDLDITHDYQGFTTPIFDALRVGEAFGNRIGLGPDTAKNLGATTARFVQAFPEIVGFGEVKTNEPGVMGLHVRESDTLGGPVALVNLDLVDTKQRGPLQKLASFLMTTAHELAHVDPKRAGAYNQQRVDSKNLIKAMFSEIGLDGTVDLLHNIEQVVLPPEYRPKVTASIADQGSGFEEEAFSRFMEYAMLGAMTKDNPWAQKTKRTESFQDAMNYLPDEIQAATHLAFRDLTNVFGAITQFYKSRPQQPQDKFITSTLKYMVDNMNKYLDVNVPKLAAMRAAVDRQRAMFAAASSVNLEDPVMVRTVLDLDEAAAREVTDDVAMSKIPDDTREAIGEAQTAMFGNSKQSKLTLAHERALGTRVPAWSHWMALSYQTMLRFHKEGNPLAETVMYKLNDLEKAYFRLNRTMHDPFMVVDEKGRLKYDPEHPLLRILQRSDPAAVRARSVLSDLARWANEAGKPVIEDGKLSPNVPAGLVQKLNSFKPEDQQGILKGIDSLLKGTQEAATILFNDRVESSAARIGAVLMTVDKTMFADKVFNISKQIVDTSVVMHNAQKALEQAKKDQTLVAELPAAQQRFAQAQQAFHQSMAGLQGEQMSAVQTYLFGKDGIAPELAALDEFFQTRKDWFTTESRPGRYFIQSHKPDNGGSHYTSAPNLRMAKQVQQRLAAQGHTGILATDRQHKPDDNMIDAPDTVLQSFINKEAAAWKSVRDAMEAHLSPEDIKFIDELGYVPGAEVAKGMETKSIKRYMQQRELTSGREELDMIDAFTDYTGRLSGSVARRGLTRELALILQDPRLRNEGEFKQVVKTMQDTLLQPLSNGLQTVRAGLTARYLGLPNFVGPMIETLQSAQGILPYFIQETGFVKGVDTFRRALTAPVQIKMNRGSLETRRTLASAKEKESIDPRAMTKQESMLLYYERQQVEGGFKAGPVYASGFSRNHQMIEQAAFGLGASKPKPVEQMIADPLYWMAQMSMVVYSTASDFNTRVAFLGALDMLYDRGLRGQELYQGASAYQNLYTHGGGKANTVGYVNKVSNPLTRSAWGLTETMQRYMFGNTTMQKDMFDQMIGRVEGATPRQKKNAAEAFATAQFVQLLLAGAMGLTGVGIAATVTQKLTKKDPKQALREFWKDLGERLGADEPTAVLLANYAQNGFISNSLGVDVSNRVTMNSFLGFNEYDGFNTNELTGVVSSTIEDLWEAGKYVAQGNMTKAGRQLASPSMRPYVDLAVSKRDYGDFALRDTGNNMITDLSPAEAVGTALGLKPYRFRVLRDAKRAEINSNEAFQMTQDQDLDELSRQLLQGNTKAVLDHVANIRSKDPMQMPQPIVRSVIDRAVAASRPQDMLATGPVGNAPQQRAIAESFGNVPRQSELQDLVTRERLNASTGFMGGPSALKPNQSGETPAVTRALLIDALVRQGKTRAEATRMVGLMGY